MSRPLGGFPQTNQRAELSAINDALHRAAIDRPDCVKIYSDSQYAIDCLTVWARNWENNGYRTVTGGSVKNAALIKTGRRRLEILDNYGVNYEFVKVSAHSNNYANDQADSLALNGARIKYSMYG